jgi:hypothetical protein
MIGCLNQAIVLIGMARIAKAGQSKTMKSRNFMTLFSTKLILLRSKRLSLVGGLFSLFEKNDFVDEMAPENATQVRKLRKHEVHLQF